VTCIDDRFFYEFSIRIADVLHVYSHRISIRSTWPFGWNVRGILRTGRLGHYRRLGVRSIRRNNDDNIEIVARRFSVDIAEAVVFDGKDVGFVIVSLD